MQPLSTKTQQVEWRRDRVLELSSQGFSQSDIATVLQVDKTIISRDMTHLKQQARNNLQKHISETIPAEYQKSMNSLNQVLRMTWSIVGKTVDEKTKLQALALIDDVNKHKDELLTNGIIINEALRIVQSKAEHLSNEEKKILHDARGDAEAAEAEDNGLSKNLEREEEQPTHNGIF